MSLLLHLLSPGLSPFPGPSLLSLVPWAVPWAVPSSPGSELPPLDALGSRALSLAARAGGVSPCPHVPALVACAPARGTLGTFRGTCVRSVRAPCPPCPVSLPELSPCPLCPCALSPVSLTKLWLLSPIPCPPFPVPFCRSVPCPLSQLCPLSLVPCPSSLSHRDPALSGATPQPPCPLAVTLPVPCPTLLAGLGPPG